MASSTPPPPRQEADHHEAVVAADSDQDQVVAFQFLSPLSHRPHQARQRPPPAQFFRLSRRV